MDNQPQPVPETPQAPPPMTLREHIEAEAAPPVSPAADAPAAVPSETPEQEAQSAKPDTELSEAGRALRRNRADERKARIQSDIDALKREEYETRDRIQRLRAEHDQLARGPVSRPQPTAGDVPAGSDDPNDPAPDSTDTAKYPDGQFDIKFIRDAAAHAGRAAYRQEQESSRARAARETYERDLTAKVTNGRTKYADFDAVLEPMVDAFKGTPHDRLISSFVAESQVGEDVLYRLGKDPALMAAARQASSPMALTRVLAGLEAQLTVPKQAPKPKTSAPPPPSQTVGSGATASEPDTRRGVPLKDHIRIEEAEIAERRRNGHRF